MDACFRSRLPDSFSVDDHTLTNNSLYERNVKHHAAIKPGHYPGKHMAMTLEDDPGT
jgi:hypothetical protein